MGPYEIAKNGTYGLDVVDIGKSKDKSAGRDDDVTTAAINYMKENVGNEPFYINIWGHSAPGTLATFRFGTASSICRR